jgi:hypothetical protein
LTTSTLSNVNIATTSDGSLGTTYTSGSFSNGPATFDFVNDYAPPVGYDELIISLSAALADSDLSSPNSFDLAFGSETDFFILCAPIGVCGSRSTTAGSLDAAPSATPLPAALPLFASGLGVIGLLARRRRKKSALKSAV